MQLKAGTATANLLCFQFIIRMAATQKLERKGKAWSHMSRLLLDPYATYVLRTVRVLPTLFDSSLTLDICLSYETSVI